MITRVPLELTAIRDRNELYVTTDSGAIENIYTLQLANMDREMHEFTISISGLEGATLIGDTVHTLNGGEIRSISMRVREDPELLTQPSTAFTFDVQATDAPQLRISSESRFLKPL